MHPPARQLVFRPGTEQRLARKELKDGGGGSRSKSMCARGWSSSDGKNETIFVQDRVGGDMVHGGATGHSSLKNLVSTEGHGEGVQVLVVSPMRVRL